MMRVALLALCVALVGAAQVHVQHTPLVEGPKVTSFSEAFNSQPHPTARSGVRTVTIPSANLAAGQLQEHIDVTETRLANLLLQQESDIQIAAQQPQQLSTLPPLFAKSVVAERAAAESAAALAAAAQSERERAASVLAQVRDIEAELHQGEANAAYHVDENGEVVARYAESVAAVEVEAANGEIVQLEDDTPQARQLPAPLMKVPKQYGVDPVPVVPEVKTVWVNYRPGSNRGNVKHLNKGIHFNDADDDDDDDDHHNVPKYDLTRVVNEHTGSKHRQHLDKGIALPGVTHVVPKPVKAVFPKARKLSLAEMAEEEEVHAMKRDIAEDQAAAAEARRGDNHDDDDDDDDSEHSTVRPWRPVEAGAAAAKQAEVAAIMAKLAQLDQLEGQLAAGQVSAKDIMDAAEVEKKAAAAAAREAKMQAKIAKVTAVAPELATKITAAIEQTAELKVAKAQKEAVETQTKAQKEMYRSQKDSFEAASLEAAAGFETNELPDEKSAHAAAKAFKQQQKAIKEQLEHIPKQGREKLVATRDATLLALGLKPKHH